MAGGEDPNKNPEVQSILSGTWCRRSIRTAPKIMATTFYGEAALWWRNINPLIPLYTHSGPVGRVANLPADCQSSFRLCYAEP